MPEIVMTELTREESLKAMRKTVAEMDEIFDKSKTQDPEYLMKLDEDFETWMIDEQKETETIVDFLRWRLTQGS